MFIRLQELKIDTDKNKKTLNDYLSLYYNQDFPIEYTFKNQAELNQAIYTALENLMKKLHSVILSKDGNKLTLAIIDVLNQLSLLQASFVQSSSHPQEMVYYIKTILFAVNFPDRTKNIEILHKLADELKGKPHSQYKALAQAFISLGIALSVAAGIVLLTSSAAAATPFIYASVGGVIAACGFFAYHQYRQKEFNILSDKLSNLRQSMEENLQVRP